MRALRTVTLLIALAGAATAHAEAKKEAPLAEVDAAKLIAFYDELVDRAVANAGDCPALGSALDGVVTRHLNTIQMSWAAKKAKKTVPPEIQARLDERALEMVDALRGCWDHDGVKAAFKRMKMPEDKAK